MLLSNRCELGADRVQPCASTEASVNSSLCLGRVHKAKGRCRNRQSTHRGADVRVRKRLMFVPQGCPNKVPQTGWLKTVDVYGLRVLEGSSLRSRCCQGRAPLEGSRAQSVSCLLLASGVANIYLLF